jgi:hypothetical protein
MNAHDVLPDLQAALLCEDVRLEVSGSNTLVGVLNMIAVPVVPFRVLKLCVFTRWGNGQGNYVQQVRILTPTHEEPIAQSDTPFKLANNETHATNVALFGGLEFKEAGDYPVEIVLNGDLRSRFFLRVMQVKPKNS